MSPQDFDFLAKFLKERSGLVLVGDKSYLIESRLSPVARRHGLADVNAVVQKLRASPTGKLEQDVVEAMTTNETFFFRDKVPFELFTDVMLPHLKASRANGKVRIWCAASSTGQEPYSLAMLLKERAAELRNISFEIIATDISSEVVERAKEGKFTQFEVQRGLPIQLLVKYFQQQGDLWQISSEIRSMVQYRTLNLLRDFSPLGQFDIVFCRNVLIYFDERAKADVLNRISERLAPDGFLVLGAAETVVGLTTAFKPHAEKRGLYVKGEKASASIPARMVVGAR